MTIPPSYFVKSHQYVLRKRERGRGTYGRVGDNVVLNETSLARDGDPICPLTRSVVDVVALASELVGTSGSVTGGSDLVVGDLDSSTAVLVSLCVNTDH